MGWTIFAIICALLPAAGSAPAAEERKVMVFAAASTTDAMNEMCALFKKLGKGEAVPSYASSSTLAKQIEQGAPADVFLSANLEWMDYLEKKNLIDIKTRENLLGNVLVLIAPAASKTTVEIKEGFPLAKLLGDGKLSMGDPDHVPVGQYGKKALEKLGVWASVEAKVARAADVRAALTLVERNEAPLGIVYSTDAAMTDKVKVIATFPEASGDPVVYPVAAVAGRNNPAAADFLTMLKSPEAKAIFRKYGFKVQ